MAATGGGPLAVRSLARKRRITFLGHGSRRLSLSDRKTRSADAGAVTNPLTRLIVVGQTRDGTCNEDRAAAGSLKVRRLQ